MIEQQGTVVSVEEGTASVRMGAVAGCPACDAGTGCGAGVFGRLLKRKPVLVHVTNQIAARPGQQVMVGIPEHIFLQLVLRLYFLPLLAGFAGAAIGRQLASLGTTHPGVLDAVTLIAAALTGSLALWLGGSKSPAFTALLGLTLLRTASVAPLDEGCPLQLAANSRNK